MFRTERITMKAANGTEVEIIGEILWPNNSQGRPQGCYIRVCFNDENGHRLEVKPSYHGTLRGKTGLVAHGLVEKYLLEIPRADYENFVNRCLDIFWEGMEKDFGRPKPAWIDGPYRPAS